MHLLRFGITLLIGLWACGQAWAQEETPEKDPLEDFRGQTVKAIKIHGANIT